MKKIFSIQYLRALAALMVVFLHALKPEPWLYNPLEHFDLGAAGVDVFFVISGFIMSSVAATETASQFVTRRLVRVVPLYWVATLLELAAKDSSGAESVAAQGPHILQSLLFIPHYSYTHPDQIWPYLVPGWTLNYEMFFYAIFAVGLLSKRPYTFALGALSLALFAGTLFHSSSAIWLTYTNPLLAEFAAGMLVFQLLRVTDSKLLIALLPLGVLVMVSTVFIPHDNLRLLMWGLPAACIVAGAITLEKHGGLPRSRMLSFIGDASYSIYLFQPFSILVARKIIMSLPIAGPAQLVAFLVCTLAISIAVGAASFRLFEKPILKAFHRKSADSLRHDQARAVRAG